MIYAEFRCNAEIFCKETKINKLKISKLFQRFFWRNLIQNSADVEWRTWIILRMVLVDDTHARLSRLEILDRHIARSNNKFFAVW